MIIYNITTKVDTAIGTAWVDWQLNEHIPEIMRCGAFNDFKFYQLVDQDDTDGPTFVIQYFAADREHYNEYKNKYAPGFIEKAFKQWGNKFIAFKTLMQPVQ